MVMRRFAALSSDEESVQLDYWVVRTRTTSFVVSAVEAEHVLRLLQRRFVPRWIGFRDLSGARIRVPAADVVMVGESTREQRAYESASLRGHGARAERGGGLVGAAGQGGGNPALPGLVPHWTTRGGS